MKLFGQLKKKINIIIYTTTAIALVLTTLGFAIVYMYDYAEELAFENLMNETERMVEEISNQLISDRENLETMASFADKLHHEGLGHELLFESFEAIGLFENIGILHPDNTMMTKYESRYVGDVISFEEEVKKGKYISGRVSDIIDKNSEIVRSAVPIVSENGETLGILYGTIRLANLEKRYAAAAESHNAYILIVEGKSGNIIANSRRATLGNVSDYADFEFKEGYGFRELWNNLAAGKTGYTSFKDRDNEEFLYVCYKPLDFADWNVMLAQHESVVFSAAKATVMYLVCISAVIMAIMLMYILLVFFVLKKMMDISECAAEIRRSLLEINPKRASLREALRMVTDYSGARSAFIIDSYNEEYHYIIPEKSNDQLRGGEVEFFNFSLLSYVAKTRKEHGAEIYFARINCDRLLREDLPDLYELMVKHGMYVINYAVVIGNENNTYVVGVIDASKTNSEDLLKKTAVCFSLALYTRTHLKRTETLALTDSLTGTGNRLAYKTDIKKMDEDKSKYSVIYIDVNELHFYNNSYGHAAGDEMLKYIAFSLLDRFEDGHVYRMGGDEFLIICKGLDASDIEKRLEKIIIGVENMNYHISFGVCHGSSGMTMDEMVESAEKQMYEDKAEYYRKKELRRVDKITERKTVILECEKQEIRAALEAMSNHCLGVYCVNFAKDMAMGIIAPTYFREVSDSFSRFSMSIKRYVYDFVKPEYHRSLLKFIEYEDLKRRIDGHESMCISFEKINGEVIILNIYPVVSEDCGYDAVWVFERE